MIEIGPNDRVVVLTGAGISAESGIPTFRGEGGLWRGRRVEEVASPEAFRRDPLLVWQFYSARRSMAADKKPNAAHFALARLEDEIGERLFLCTQNVDELHEAAGSKRVTHMHGRLFQSRCERCGRPPFDDREIYEEKVPACICGSRLRPHICWFGETPYELNRIYAALETCTLFVAIGTSGLVHPAASFVAQAHLRAGPQVHTYYVGPQEPANRFLFNKCFLGKAGEVLPGLFSVLKSGGKAETASRS